MRHLAFIILCVFSYPTLVFSQGEVKTCDVALYDITDASFCSVVDSLILAEKKLGISVSDSCPLQLFAIQNDSSLFLLRRVLTIKDTHWTTFEMADRFAYTYCGSHCIEIPVCKNIEKISQPNGMSVRLPCVYASEIAYEEIYPDENEIFFPHITMLVKSDTKVGCKIIRIDYNNEP